MALLGHVISPYPLRATKKEDEDVAETDIYRGNVSGYIKNSLSKINPEDQEDVKRLPDDLAAQGYSERRLLKIASTLAGISSRLTVSFKDAKIGDIKRYVAWLERSHYKAWTKNNHKTILRHYMRWLGRAETVNWMQIKKPSNGTLPEEVHTEEDIKAIAGAAYTSRDRAFVLGLYESGARIGEFLPLKIKHLSFDRHGAVLRVTGKTGDRRIRLVASALAFHKWLDEHPRKDDPEAYLWCKIPMPNNPKWKNQHLSYGFICRLLRELAAKAGVKKKVNPHSFRHARATFLANHLTEAQMREFFGWGKDSEMPALYVHLSGRDVDNAIMGVYGLREAKESQDPVLKVQQCPRCQELNDPASRFCGKCGLPLNQLSEEDRLVRLVVELLKIVAETNPGIKDGFRELVKEKYA